MEKKGLSDYLELAKLSIKNSVMEAGSSVLFLGGLIGLVVMMASFFCYGLIILLEAQLGYPGAVYLLVGGVGHLGSVGVFIGMRRSRRIKIARLKVAISDSQKTVLNTAELEALVQKYPWGTTGLAVGLGFAASSQVYFTDLLMPLIAEVLAAQKLTEERP